MEEYPREVRAPPLLLAALVGATPLHQRLTEALHEAAANTCGQRRLKYLSLDYDVRIPPCKRGAKDHQGYRIAGILKKRWLEKVCNEVPSVLVLCFDWSGERQVPAAEEAQALQRLQHLRRQAASRQLRLLLFAVVHAGATDLDSACSFLRQQPEGRDALVVAAGTADLAAKAAKLEGLVYRSSMAFYHEEEKRHRRSWATKPQGVTTAAHNAMQVRNSFKVGFLSEMRRDARGALRSYITAYELLRHDVEVADVVERMELCNHITIRMYQLYLQSHDVGAAVFHCRTHSATLRACNATDEAVVWRKWNWLAGNHHVFAELLENVAQQLPLLLDQVDLLQFPGYHYQCAATYVGKLKNWAVAAESGGTLPLPTLAGGELADSPFVGQAGAPERPEECPDPAAEARLRGAHRQAAAVLRGDRRLQLLNRALAACKERGYAARAAAIDAWIAEEYIGSGDLAAASLLLGRLRRGSWSAWPSLRALALERAVLCGCRALGLPEPALCSRSSQPPRAPASGAGAGEARGEDCGDGPRAARRGLLLDVLEHLGLAADGALGAATPGAWRSELESLLGALGAQMGGGGEPVEVRLRGVAGEAEFGPAGAAGLPVVLRLHSSLAVALQASGASASTTHGDLELSCDGPAEGAASGGAAFRLQAGEPLRLTGLWPRREEEADVRLLSVRLRWAACPAVCFVVDALALERGGQAPPLLPPPRVPGVGQPASAAGSRACGGEARRGLAPPAATAPGLRAEVLTPVDPGTALTAEPFVFYVVLFSRPPAEGGPGATGRLLLSCPVAVQHEPDERGAEEPHVALLSRAGGEALDTIPLLGPGASGAGGAQAVADVAEDGRLAACGPVLALPPGQLARWPLAAREGEVPLVVPVVVRCGRGCRAAVSVSLQLRTEGGGSAAVRCGPAVQLRFRAALLPAFDGRPAQRASAALRRFTLKAGAGTPVELHAVEVAVGGEAARPALGRLGAVAPGALHAFAAPAGPAREAGPATLAVSFSRAGGAAAFCPWAGGGEEEPLRLDLLPRARASWPFPDEAPASAAVAGPSAATGADAAPLRVELEHAPTGDVAQPLEVRVRLRRTAPGPVQELRVQLLQGEGGQGSDRFLVSGPTSTQAILFATAELEPQLCCTFSLVPLKPGSLAMPRVQVSAGAAEAVSGPSSVFVLPRAQPAVWRSVA